MTVHVYLLDDQPKYLATRCCILVLLLIGRRIASLWIFNAISQLNHIN